MSAKSLFITPFITLASVAMLHGIFHLATDSSPSLLWVSASVSGGIIALFFGWLMLLRPTARTGRHIFWVGVPIAAAVLASAAGIIFGEREWLPLLYTALSGIGWALYELWYSALPVGQSTLAVGNPLPDFELENPAGAQSVSSRSFRGKKALLIFYRGNWCPLCMAQIREVAAAYQQLEAHGVETYLISPQPSGKSDKLARRFDAPMRFLVDRGNHAAKTLGIVHAGGLPVGMQAFGYDSDTVLPTVVLTDEEGLVLRVDRTDNYRIRPEPQTFLRWLDESTSESQRKAG